MEPCEGVLGRIVAHKREEIARRASDVPITEMRRRAIPTTRSLRDALARPGTRFVLEHKRASPSQGPLRPTTSTSPREVAQAYEGAADAMSVLTDTRFFGGSFDDLHAVRDTTDVPVLCKDFVVSPYQVIEARTHGADAVLLMLSVLDDATARACMLEADALGMDCLVEVHDESELLRALGLPARIVGINHRDLRTLAIDLAVTERLAPLVPPGVVVVAESGISSRRDVDRLAPLVDAFLVGSSLMREHDVRDAARALVFGRVKVCGLTDAEGARLVAAAGATLGGVVFAKESPRCVSLERAERIAAAGHLPLVGVFVNEPIEQIVRAAWTIGLAAVQLHGDEDAAYVRALKASLPAACAVWKAAHVAAPGILHTATAASAQAEEAADRIVFDTALPVPPDGRPAPPRGGTGVAFDWRTIAAHPDLARGVLAGGIGPDNAVAARAVGTWAIDVGSRLEERPGSKDPARVAALFTNLRGAGRRPPTFRATGPASAGRKV